MELGASFLENTAQSMNFITVAGSKGQDRKMLRSDANSSNIFIAELIFFHVLEE